MPTLADRKIAQMQQVTGETRSNLTDLEWDFYSANSGLSPANKYSISDHKLAYYKLYGVSGKTLQEVEKSFFSLMGAQGADYDSIAYDFYTNFGFGPGSISGLAAWYDASSISSTVIAKDTFDRSKNLLSGQDPSFEVNGAAGWSAVNTNTGTITADGTTAFTGTTSLKIITDGPTSAQSFQGAHKNLGAGLFPVGVTCTVSVKVKGTAGAKIRLAALMNGSRFANSIDTGQTLSGGWDTISLTGTTPTPATSLDIYVDTGNLVQATTFWVDALQVEVGSQATPFVWGDATHLGVSDSGHVWTLLNGGATTGISGGKAVTTGNIAIAIDVGTPDVDISVLMPTVGPGFNDCVIFRITDVNNNYRITQSQLYKVVAGVPTALGSHTQTFVAGDVMRVTALGTTITIYRNGNQVNQLTDATYTTQTKQGVILDTGSSQIDNFTVSTPIYSDGAALPIWPDISGNYRHALQTTAGLRPLLRTGSFLPPTGKPTVKFDGVDDALTVNSFINNLTGLSIFVVAKDEFGGPNGTLAGAELQAKIKTSGATSWVALADDDGSAPWLATLSQAISSTNAWHHYELVIAGGVNATTYADGAQTNQTTFTSPRIGTTANAFGIGSLGTSEWLNGEIAAVLVFNRALSTNERQRVERYLKARYGTP